MNNTTELHHGDCLDVMRELPEASVDAIVTDPPYGLGFMGKAWDDLPPGEEWATECLRVLKPGGHLLAFGGTRTWHRLAVAVEEAGFEVRDSIAWLYGSGFPKSLDVSKAIDKAAGAEREVVGTRVATGNARKSTSHTGIGAAVSNKAEPRDYIDTVIDITAPATEDARTWQGWGTALKPAFEPIVVARKPLVGTVAANALAHGTGALNVDGCRIESDGGHKRPFQPSNTGRDVYGVQAGFQPTNAEGRWPANVVLDESQAAELDEQSEGTRAAKPSAGNVGGQGSNGDVYGDFDLTRPITRGEGFTDSGGASRFFYTAKAATDERVRVAGVAHPTVKPLSLMRWLVRLVTPPGGTVLEPFAGSGTTVEACILEGFGCIAIEREAEYLPLIQQRIDRRHDPVAAVRATQDDAGLFDLLGEEPA